MPVLTETLASYRTKVLRELRDAQQLYFTTPPSVNANPNFDLDAWINESIAWRDLWSGGSRAYKAAVPTTVGVGFYTLATLFPTDTVLDVINLWLIWGNYRRPLSELALGVITRGPRALVTYTDVPAAYCRYGATQVVIAAAPSGPYTTDWDVATLSVILVNPADADPLPYPYTTPVIKYAAYLAKQNQRRFDESQIFYNEALRALNDIEGSRVGQLPQPVSVR